MKPPHQLERENAELRQVGLDLHKRAEQWRKALEEIKRMSNDPFVNQIITRNLNV